MQKQIINNTQGNKIRGLGGTDFAVMTNDSKVTKRMLTLLLKKFILVIELLDKTVIEASYKDFKLLARTPDDILLVFNELTGTEVEICVSDIRIVRVFSC
ncbi:MAG: hypothetical protein N4A64_09020 [Marinisporobacter sp.]|jgi:hypothetical protein|nr:hypothetical protein [Marinisporobacter sp.]